MVAQHAIHTATAGIQRDAVFGLQGKLVDSQRHILTAWESRLVMLGLDEFNLEKRKRCELVRGHEIKQDPCMDVSLSINGTLTPHMRPLPRTSPT